MDGGFSWIIPSTLAFDPSLSPHYRIVCFKKETTESNSYFRVFMYLSETGTWYCTTSTFEVNVCPDMSARILSNGVVHWVCHEQYIHFDINEGKMMLMTLPFIYGVINIHGKLVVFGNGMALSILPKKMT